MATSDSNIEVWWEPVPLRTRVIGYEIFYSMSDAEDLTKWQRKTVGLTTSAELVNLERMYLILLILSILMIKFLIKSIKMNYFFKLFWKGKN